MRESAEEMVRQAAQAGVKSPWRLMQCTPAEIQAEFEALAAQRQIHMQHADLQAWLTGRYVMIAMHAPKRYPKRPDAVSALPRTMTDAQMKRVFEGIAAKRRNEHGSG